MDSTLQQSIKTQTAVNGTHTSDSIPEVSKRSSSTTSNIENKSAITSEDYQRRLEENRHFFNNRPLMRSLDADEDQFLRDMLFEDLMKEVQQKAFKEDADDRGQLQIRVFWYNVRMQLKDDEKDTDALEHWPGWEKVVDATEIEIKD